MYYSLVISSAMASPTWSICPKWADMALGSLHGGFMPNPCYARAFVGLLPSNPGQTDSR